MQWNMMGTALAADNPTAAAAFFADHFGFVVGADLGWYVTAQHPAHPNLSLDFIDRKHPSWPEATRGATVGGTLLAFIVEDADAEHARLEAAGLTIVMPLVTEPWGQRRFQVSGPDGVLVEVLQRVAPDPAWLAANGLG